MELRDMFEKWREQQEKHLAFNDHFDLTTIGIQELQDFGVINSGQLDFPDLINDPLVNTNREIHVPLNAGGKTAVYKGGTGSWGGYKNGEIPFSSLVPIANGNHKAYGYGGKFYLLPDAAKNWLALVARAKSEGFDLRVTSAFRSHEHQSALYSNNHSGSVAKPGNSNHGWGRAVDVTGLFHNAHSLEAAAKMRQSKLYKFLERVGAQYGFFNPEKLKDNEGVSEAWHWEYWGDRVR